MANKFSQLKEDSMENLMDLKFNDVIKIIKPYKNLIIIFLISLSIVFAATWGYFSYTKSLAQQAHKSFIECMKYYDVALGNKYAKKSDIENLTSLEKWKKVEQVFHEAYAKHGSSGLGAIFLAFESEALLFQGKFKESLDLLKSAVETMKSSTLKQLYSIKYSLMQLDSNDETQHKEGLDRLQKYAQDFDSVDNDQVLYQLGDYYWNKEDFIQAKNYWNQLIHKYGPGTKDPSPWISLAKNKLNLISDK